MVALAQQPSEELLLAAVLVNYLTLQGHSCVDLALQAEQPFPPLEISEITVDCPPLTTWLTTLQNCSVVGQPGVYAPLVLDKTRLYLYRYWQYEQQLLQSIQDRCQQPPVDLTLSTSPRVQYILSRHFAMLSGGPGSGKTTFIFKLLAALLQHQQCRIALTAPTGKATLRLQQLLSAQLHEINPSAVTTATLHRLLGSQLHTPYFHYNAHHPLPYDVVIVDEASRVDLALMAKLAQAIPLSARWILVGDPDQLTSIATGSVFSDLCQATLHNQALNAHKVSLTQNYRVHAESGIHALAQAINAGEAEQAMQLLKSNDYDDIHWQGVHHPTLERLTEPILKGFTPYLTAETPQQALAAFEHFRVISPLRQGPYGVIALNQWIEQLLQAKGLIQLNYHWYVGRPLMITGNDYQLNLFNGDSGVLWWGFEDHHQIQAYFPSVDAQPLCFWPQRLPEHETAYALTIHKSQGSEFDELLIILPDNAAWVLTRELIYTAVTRARRRLTIWGSEQVFKTAVSKQVHRTSGIIKALGAYRYL